MIPTDDLGDLFAPDEHEVGRLREWNATSVARQNQTVDEIITSIAARFPERMAASFKGESLTYLELDSRARTLTEQLVSRGIGAGRAVAIALPPSLERLIGVLGVIRSGACYSPLDLENPIERLRAQIEDLGDAAFIGDRALAAQLGIRTDLEDSSPSGIRRAHSADDPIYVIFTSGSTGRPKGCINCHRGLANRLLWMGQSLGVTPDDRILHKTAFGFDVSVWEQLLPLMYGACVVIADADARKDANALRDIIVAERVTIAHFVPTLLEAFLDGLEAGATRSLRTIVCSGEALPPTTARACWQQLDVNLYNYYGPTEAAIDVTFYKCTETTCIDGVPIGHPIDNVEVHVLGNDLQQLPVGATGELYIGGVAVGPGYLGRARQTAERFIPDPFSNCPGARLYRTGDLVRRRADGAVEFIGRRDGQVKIRGFRIELGEIESAIRSHPYVAQAAVMLRLVGRRRRPQLVAYVVARQPFETADLQASVSKWCESRLPSYMMPGAWVSLDNMPATVNGKLDRRALPELPEQADADHGEQPANATEQALAEIWGDLLGLRQPSVTADFFSVGGDSVTAIKLVARARRIGLVLETRQVFDARTIRALAGLAGTLAPTGHTARAALFPVRLWSNEIDASEAVWALVQVATDQIEAGIDWVLDRACEALSWWNTGTPPSPATRGSLVARGTDVEHAIRAAQEASVGSGQPGIAFAVVSEPSEVWAKIVIAFSPRVADASTMARILSPGVQDASGGAGEEWIRAIDAIRPAHDLATLQLWGGRPRAASPVRRGTALLGPETHGRHDPAGGTDDPAIDLVVGCALTALEESGLSRVECLLPESRAWAAASGWSIANAAGRVGLQAVAVIDSSTRVGWHERLCQLRGARHGEAQRPLRESQLRCEFVVLRLHRRQAESGVVVPSDDMASHLASQGRSGAELTVAAVILDDTIHFAWASVNATSAVDAAFGRFAQRIARAARESDWLNIRVPADFPLATVSTTELEANSVRLGSATDAYTLSAMQEGILFRSIFWPQSDVYHNQNVIELHGPLREDCFAQAWMLVVERYEALRTGYCWEGLLRPVQYVARSAEGSLQQLDWSDCQNDAEAEQRLAVLLDHDRKTRIDLGRAGLWRLWLILTAPNKAIVVWSHHHVMLDGWCLSLIWGDVFKFYGAMVEGRLTRGPRPRPFHDYVAWLRARANKSGSLTFWHDYLDGFETPTRFSDRPVDLEGRFDTRRIRLSVEQTSAITELARESRVTTNAVIQAAWSLMLGMKAGATDVVHGVAVSGRPPELVGSEWMVGLFINTVPLRLRHEPGISVEDFLARVQTVLVEANEHSQIPLTEIIGEWRGRRNAADRLFDSLIAFENYPEENLPQTQVAGLQVVDRFCDEKTEYPFGLIVLPGTQMELHFNYDSAHFSLAEVLELVDTYLQLLNAMTEKPKTPLVRLPARLGATTRSVDAPQITRRSRETTHDTLVGIFRRAVESHPDRPALDSGDQQLTYSQLSSAADTFASRLTSHGLGRADIVALRVERSVSWAEALLGCLLARVPVALINPAHPDEWVAAAIEAIDASAIVRDGSIHRPRARARNAGKNPRPADGEPPIILFTSGSTGEPKAVICDQSALADRIFWTLESYDRRNAVRVLANAAPGFDIGLWEFWFAFAAGGCAHIADNATVRDPAALARRVAADSITALHVIPSTLDLLIQMADPAQLSSLRLVVTGGDVVPPGLVERVCQKFPSLALWHGYGPTEASISITDHRCSIADSDRARVPLGDVMPGAVVRILDRWMRPAPLDVEGDLYIGGPCLARGYAGAAAATSSAFVPDAWGEPGSRMYRTGDRARWLRSGGLEFAGRRDRQIKIMGQRVDLEGLEALLRRHPLIGEIAVVAPLHAGEPRITAWMSLVAGSAGPDDRQIDAVRTWLASRVPAAARPTAWHVCDRLPRTATGKIHRRTLVSRCAAQIEDAPPTSSWTPAEAAVAEAWCAVLGYPPQTRDQNFFLSGGHSLAAMRVVALLRKRLGTASRVEVSHLLKFPTVGGMAEAIFCADAGSGRQSVVELRTEGSETLVVLIHPVQGTSMCYSAASDHVLDRPVHAINNPRFMTDRGFESLAEMASLYVEWVRALTDERPVILAGWSFGGVVALEMATQMRAHGGRVEKVVLIDSFNFSGGGTTNATDVVAGTDAILAALPPDLREPLREEISRNTLLATSHVPQPYDGPVALVIAQGDREGRAALGERLGWGAEILPHLQVLTCEGTHHELFDARHATRTWSTIGRALRAPEAANAAS